MRLGQAALLNHDPCHQLDWGLTQLAGSLLIYCLAGGNVSAPGQGLSAQSSSAEHEGIPASHCCGGCTLWDIQ